MDKITEQDLANRGVKGLPDVPGLTTEEMQRKLEEIAREILIPKVNELVEGLNNANSNLKIFKRKISCVGCAVSNTVIYAPVTFPTRINGISSYQVHNNQSQVTNVGVLPATIEAINTDSCKIKIIHDAGTLTVGNAYVCEFELTAY